MGPPWKRTGHVRGMNPRTLPDPPHADNRERVAQVNVIADDLRKIGLDCRIQLAGSSEEYGMVNPDEVPITEDNPLRPLSPYGVSKVAQDLLGYQYYMSYKMDIVRTRGFNHTGPRRPPVFVCSDFAKQIVDIEKGLRPPVMYVGNLDAKRDFTDVRDIVRGYFLALEKGKSGQVYNICSEKCYSMREILDMLLAKSNIKIEIKLDKSRLRPSDVPLLIGSCDRFREDTGWKPVIPFDQTLQEILDFWRNR